jgi:hypothetical protein
MTHDALEGWIKNARQSGGESALASGIRVIRNPKAPSRGAQIMEIAEKLRPWFAKMFEGVRDENGMLVQPARVRGIALNVAQRIVQEEEGKLAHG